MTWPSWKTIFVEATAVGFLFAACVMFDWSTLAKAFGYVIVFFLYLALAATLTGLVVGCVTNQRWAIPRWFFGSVALVFVVYTVHRFVVNKLAVADAADWRFLMLSVVFGLVGLWVVWKRTSWSSPQLVDLTWDVFSGLSGLLLGLMLLVGPLAWWAERRQTDIDDNRIDIPIVSGISGTYVALGDSYSAGEGITPFQPGSPRNCNRSPFAYPLKLQFDEPVEVEFEACSGAVTHDVDLEVTGGTAPQITPGPHDSVALVTITIGGNDVVFSDIVQHCVLYENCLHQRFRPRVPHPGKPTIGYPREQDLDPWITEALGLVRVNISRVYDSIKAAYPDTARVVVLGYPYLFPRGDAPWDQIDCASLLRRVDSDERETLADRVDELNEVLYALAMAHEFDFISPAAAWEGHEACGSDGQYTNAVKPGPRLANPVDGATLHPNKRGQEQYARLIACYLNANPVRPVPSDVPPGAIGNEILCT